MSNDVSAAVTKYCMRRGSEVQKLQYWDNGIGRGSHFNSSSNAESGAQHTELRPWRKIRYSTAQCSLVGTHRSEDPSWALKTKRSARAIWPHGLAARMQRGIVSCSYCSLYIFTYHERAAAELVCTFKWPLKAQVLKWKATLTWSSPAAPHSDRRRR